MLAVSKILPLPGPGLVKPQDQRLGSFVVWFNVAAPPWSKEGHLVGRPACQQLQGLPACVPSLPSSLGLDALRGPPGGGGGSGLLSTPSKFQGQSGLLSAERSISGKLLLPVSILPTPSHPHIPGASQLLSWLTGAGQALQGFRLGGLPSPSRPQSLRPPWPVWGLSPEGSSPASVRCVTAGRPRGPGLCPDA